MPEWNDAKSALVDTNFHDLPLEDKVKFLKNDSTTSDFSDSDINDVLGKTFDKFYIPKEKRFKKEEWKNVPGMFGGPMKVPSKLPDSLKELYRDPAFHGQSIEEKRLQSRQVDPEFGILGQNDQDEILGKMYDKYAQKKPLTPPPPSQFGQPTQPITMTPSIGLPMGLQKEGNIDLTTRPVVTNKDGSQSTVRSMSFNLDGKEILVPTVGDDGGIMNDQQAIDHYMETGQHLGIFDTPEHANRYARRLHLDYERGAIPGYEGVIAKNKAGMPPPEDSGIFNEIWQGSKEGTQSAIEAGGGLLQWVGQMAGTNTVKQWGKDIEDWSANSIKYEQPPDDAAGSMMEKPWLMTDPRWWARSAGSFVPYATIFSGLSMGATALAALTLPEDATAAGVLALAAGYNAVINSLFVGSSQYVEEKKAGRSDHDASVSAATAATIDLPWTFITSKVGPFGNKEAGNIIKSAFRNMWTQGVQLGGQTLIENASNRMTGGARDLFQGVPESVVKGGVLGPIIGKAVDLAIPSAIKPKLPTQESMKTLDLQIRAAQRGTRPVVIFQNQELLPRSIKGLERYDYEMSSTDPTTGEETKSPAYFFYNPDRITPNEIKEAVDTGNMARLGFLDKKSKDTTHVVSVVDKNGNEVLSAAVKPENVDAQKAKMKEMFPDTEEENKGSAIISGKIEDVNPVIESQRTNPSIDNVSKTGDIVKDIITGKQDAPQGVTVEPNERVAAPVITPTEDLPIKKADEDLQVGEKTKAPADVTKESSTQKETPEQELNRLKKEVADRRAELAKAEKEKGKKPVSIPPPPDNIVIDVVNGITPSITDQYNAALAENAKLKPGSQESVDVAPPVVSKTETLEEKLNRLELENARLEKESAILEHGDAALSVAGELNAPPPIPSIIKEADPATVAEYNRLLAEREKLLQEKQSIVSSEAPAGTKSTEQITDEVRALDAFHLGMLIKDSDGNEYVRREGGWKKKDKNGQDRGRTILTKTIVEKKIFNSEDYKHYITLGKRWSYAPEAKGVAVPRGRKTMGRIIEVGGEMPKSVIDEGQQSALEALLEKENETEAIEETRKALQEEERKKDGTESSETPASNTSPYVPESTVETSVSKKITVLRKKTKTLPPPQTAAAENAPNVGRPATPKVEKTIQPVERAAEEVRTQPDKPITIEDYKIAVQNIDSAFEQLAELEAEIDRRKGMDQTGLVRNNLIKQGLYHNVPSDMFNAVKTRLTHAINILGKTIDTYEGDHPEVGKAELKKAVEFAPPPESTTLQPQKQGETTSPGRLLTGDERKMAAYRLQVKYSETEPSLMDQQSGNTSMMGETTGGQQMSTGEFQVGDKKYRVDFTHDRGDPNKNRNIRYIYDLDKEGLQAPPESSFGKQPMTEAAKAQMQDNILKDTDNLREEYHAATTIEDKTKLFERVMDESEEKGAGKTRVENLVLALEEGAETPEDSARIEGELNQILGPEESTEAVLEDIGNNAPPNLDNVQAAFGLPPREGTRTQGIGSRKLGVRDSDTGKLLGIRGIVIKLSRALDVPVRFKITSKGIPPNKRPLGLFRNKAESIELNPKKIREQADATANGRTRLTELDVMAHEVGHYFDLLAFRDGKAEKIDGVPTFGIMHDSEVNRLGADVLTAGGINPATADINLIRSEGIADFFGRYISGDRIALRKDAPAFYDFVQDTLKRYPAVSDVFDQASHDISLYRGSDTASQFRSRILRSTDVEKMFRPSSKERLSNMFLQMRKMFETRIASTHDAIRRMQKLDPSKKEDLEHLDNLMFNEKGKTEEQSLYSMVKGFVDLDGNVDPNVRPLVWILKQVDNMQDFDAYLAAVNARDMEKPRVGPDGVTLLRQRKSFAPKEEYMAEIARGEAKYGDLANELGKWANAHLQLLVDAGNISQETYNKITNSRLTYAPLWKVAESMGKVQGARGGGGGITNLRVGPQFAKGGGGDAFIHSPLESLVKNMVLYRAIARKNNLAEKFFSAVDQIQGGGRIATEERSPVLVTKVPESEVINKLHKYNIDTDELKEQVREQLGLADTDSINFGVELYKTLSNGDKSDLTIVHRRDGKPVIYKIGDEDLYNSLTASDARLTAFDKNIIGQVMRKQASILRAGAILDPRFSLRNIVRDPFQAFVFAHYGFNPWDWAKGFVSTVMGGNAVDEFHRNAAGFADQMSQDMDGLHKMVEHILGQDKNLMERFGDKWKNAQTPKQYADLAWQITGGGALSAMQKIGHVFEEATRVGLYTKTLDVLTNGNRSSATPQQIEIAVREAKDTTLPYHRAGTVGAFLNKYIPFTNANLQDISKFAREHTLDHIWTFNREDGRWFANNTILKGIVYNAPMALLTWWMGKDDEKIQNLPAWRQAGFWNVNLRGVTGSDFVMSIPKPFLVGQTYSSSIEAALRWMYKKDPNAITKWATGVVNQIIPNVLPTGPLPLIENYLNYNTFRASPIENQSMQQLQSEYRANPNTTSLAETIAHGTQWTGRLANSPVKIDNLIRGWTGSLGGAAAGGASMLIDSFTSNDIPVPSKTVAEWFPVSAFALSPYTPSDYMRRFYDASKRSDELIKTYDAFNRNTEFTDAEKFYEKNQDRINWYLSDQATGKVGASMKIAKTKEDLSAISKEMIIVKKSPDIPSSEKTKQLLELSKLRDDIAKESFEELFTEEDQREVF